MQRWMLNCIVGILLPIAVYSSPWPKSQNKWIDSDYNASDLERFRSTNECPLKVTYSKSFRGNRISGYVAIIVEDVVFDRLEGDLLMYSSQLNLEGWDVELLSVENGHPEDLKQLLVNLYNNELDGVLFIGDLPIAFYRLEGDFGSIEFPIDLFYMDLDGIWLDTDQDTVYDGHDGNISPEIWVGRLLASPLTASGQEPVAMFRHYLNKATVFRHENTPYDMPPLVFADPSFGSDSYQGSDAVNWLFGRYQRTVSSSPQDYRNALNISYPWISVYVHGGTSAHAFGGGPFYSTELVDIDNQTRFFSDFSCSNARYTSPEYMGGWYIFSPGVSLALLGSTKTGSIYYLNDIVNELDKGSCLGDAYLHWAKLHINQNPPWFYGATLLGDPTLTSHRQPMIDSIYIDDSGEDADGFPEPGETVQLWFELVNRTSNSFENGLTGYLESGSSKVTVLSGNPVFFFEVQPGGTTQGGPFSVRLSSDLKDAEIPLLTLWIISDQDIWSRPVHMKISAPELRTGPPFINDNDDNVLSPGEHANILIPLENIGSGNMDSTLITVESLSSYLNIGQNNVYSISLDAMERLWIGPVDVFLSGDCPANKELLVRIYDEMEAMEDLSLLIPNGTMTFAPEYGWCGTKHKPVTEHAFDQWQIDENHFICGRSGGLPYNSGMDAALYLPEFLIEGDVVLSVTHRMTGEDAGGGLAYDGGRVEIDEGNGFIPLQPESGYPAVFTVGTTAEPGSPCWHTIPDWRTDLFDIEPSRSAVRIRFRFVSDGGLSYSGWQIQEITLSGNVKIYPPSPYPSPTPTPVIKTGVTIDMPTYVSPGDQFWIDGYLNNSGSILNETNVFFVLGVYGEFWFWPSWRHFCPQDPNSLDFQTMDVFPGTTHISVLEGISWPDVGEKRMTGLTFYGAMVDKLLQSLIGDMAMIEWGFGPLP
ncbi:hypothetical protein JW979_00850 [bacterium]|nr:hypothetical protein [candidate division CSSED10-310 bacterium]